MYQVLGYFLIIKIIFFLLRGQPVWQKRIENISHVSSPNDKKSNTRRRNHVDRSVILGNLAWSAWPITEEYVRCMIRIESQNTRHFLNQSSYKNGCSLWKLSNIIVTNHRRVSNTRDPESYSQNNNHFSNHCS